MISSITCFDISFSENFKDVMKWMQHACLVKSSEFISLVFRMREKVGLKVVKALKRNNEAVTHAALDMLCALMQVCRKCL